MNGLESAIAKVGKSLGVPPEKAIQIHNEILTLAENRDPDAMISMIREKYSGNERDLAFLMLGMEICLEILMEAAKRGKF